MSITDKIKKFVTDAGFKLNNFNGHSCGLPGESFVRVAADYSPIDGPSFLAVFTDRVVRYGLRTPFNYNDWFSLDSRRYETPQELVSVLEGMARRPEGCWA